MTPEEEEWGRGRVRKGVGGNLHHRHFYPSAEPHTPTCLQERAKHIVYQRWR